MKHPSFHLTPEGPEQCRRRFRACILPEHFPSLREAENVLQQRQRAQDHLQELKRLKKVLSSSKRRGGGFSLGQSPVRWFAHKIDGDRREGGSEQLRFLATGHCTLRHEDGYDVTVTITRTEALDEQEPCLYGVWKFTVQQVLGGSRFNTRDFKETIELDFRTSPESSFKIAHRVFYEAAVRAFPEHNPDLGDPEPALAEAERLSALFLAMFNAAESESSGDVDLYERGYGYFAASDGDIVVDVDYLSTAFRGVNFARFLDSDYFWSSDPDVNLRVSDTFAREGTSWALYRADGRWGVNTVSADGTSTDRAVDSPQDAYELTYDHQLVARGGKMASEMARYAKDLVRDVEEELHQHRQQVASRQAAAAPR